LHCFRYIFFSCAAAIVTGLGDEFPMSVAMRAGGTDGKKTAGLYYLTAPFTGAAYFGR